MLTLKKQFNLIDKTRNELREEKIKKIPNFDTRDIYSAFLEEKEKNRKDSRYPRPIAVNA